MWTLMHFRFCPLSRAIRIALGELSIPVALEEFHPWDWPEALVARNPSGELPVLRLDSGLVVCGSYAAIEHLASLEISGAASAGPVPERPASLMPAAETDRAEVRRLVDWFHGKMHWEATAPLIEAQIMPLVRGRSVPPPEADKLRAARANLGYHLDYVDWLADQRKWLAGDTLSFADLAAIGHLSCLDYLGEIDWSRHGPAKDWYQRLKSRPSFRPLLADIVPGRAPAAHYADLDF